MKSREVNVPPSSDPEATPQDASIARALDEGEAAVDAFFAAVAHDLLVLYEQGDPARLLFVNPQYFELFRERVPKLSPPVEGLTPEFWSQVLNLLEVRSEPQVPEYHVITHAAVEQRDLLAWADRVGVLRVTSEQRVTLTPPSHQELRLLFFLWCAQNGAPRILRGETSLPIFGGNRPGSLQ